MPELPPPLLDLNESLTWKPGASTMSGRAANAIVNATLHDLDRSFAAYMGEPAVPSLLTYAKHASRTVGIQIARMEATLRFIRYLDFNALADLRRDMAKSGAVRGQAKALLSELVRNPLRFYRTLGTLRHAIQWGNLQAYESLVPAFGTYLAAETAGEDGVAALRAAGYGVAPLDPAGLVLHAFGLYQASQRMGAAMDESRRSERAAWVANREEVAFRATLTLSLHEQMLFQTSECYEDPVVKRVVGKLTPRLAIEDPFDTMYLLPDGGNWAEFTDRMGVAHRAVVDPRRLAGEGRPAGTIFAYLSSRFLDPIAAAGVAEPPLPLPAYDDGEGRALDRLRQSYRRVRGDYRPGTV